MVPKIEDMRGEPVAWVVAQLQLNEIDEYRANDVAVDEKNNGAKCNLQDAVDTFYDDGYFKKIVEYPSNAAAFAHESSIPPPSGFRVVAADLYVYDISYTYWAADLYVYDISYTYGAV